MCEEVSFFFFLVELRGVLQQLFFPQQLFSCQYGWAPGSFFEIKCLKIAEFVYYLTLLLRDFIFFMFQKFTYHHQYTVEIVERENMADAAAVKFKAGQVVWLKVKRYSWPAVILNEKQAKSVHLFKHEDKMTAPNIYRVALLGSRRAYIVKIYI